MQGSLRSPMPVNGSPSVRCFMDRSYDLERAILTTLKQRGPSTLADLFEQVKEYRGHRSLRNRVANLNKEGKIIAKVNFGQDGRVKTYSLPSQKEV